MELFNHEAERALIGSILMRPALALDFVRIEPEDFHDRHHASIWRAIRALAGQEFDSTILKARLAEHGNLSEPVRERLLEAEERTFSPVNAQALADTVDDRSQRRRYLDVTEEVRAAVLDGNKTAAELHAIFEAAILKATRTNRRTEPKSMGEAMQAYFREVNETRGKDGNMGIATGLPKFDKKYRGLRRGQVIVIAARPGVGKSTLALQFAMGAARQGLRSLLFSLEMAAEELSPRALATELECPEDEALRRIDEGHDGFMAAYSAAAGKLSQLPIDIDDGLSSTMTQLGAQARRWKMKHPDLGLILVDYLQLLQSGKKRPDSREVEIAEVSRGLKLLALQLKLPVVVLSQLNRESEKDERPPRLSDLRGSGAIEQDADMVMFIHPSMKDQKPGRGGAIAVDLLIEKARKGGPGFVPCWFFTEWSTFGERDVR